MVEKQKSNNKSKKYIKKCFQYAITVALNYQKKNNNNNPQEIYNIKPFIDQYDWNEIEFP